MCMTFYIPSVSSGSKVAEIYTYRRDKEDLGTMYYTINDNKWHVLDYMNSIKVSFDSEKQAREFIKTSTPILE